MKWVIKNGKTCFRAEGDFSLASIMGSFPECYKENPQDSVKGIFILNCEKSELHNSMMFTES